MFNIAEQSRYGCCRVWIGLNYKWNQIEDLAKLNGGDFQEGKTDFCLQTMKKKVAGGPLDLTKFQNSGKSLTLVKKTFKKFDRHAIISNFYRFVWKRFPNRTKMSNFLRFLRFGGKGCQIWQDNFLWHNFIVFALFDYLILKYL